MRNNRKPTTSWIGRSDETEKLYQLEEKRNELIKATAKELQRLHAEGTVIFRDDISGHKEAFWEVFMPQTLFDILEGFQGGEEAAVAYAEHKGYTVTKPTADTDPKS